MTLQTEWAARIAHYTATLLDRGYCLIPDALPPALIDDLDHDLEEDFA